MIIIMTFASDAQRYVLNHEYSSFFSTRPPRIEMLNSRVYEGRL
jgi:hypothetical protein